MVQGRTVLRKYSLNPKTLNSRYRKGLGVKGMSVVQGLQGGGGVFWAHTSKGFARLSSPLLLNVPVQQCGYLAAVRYPKGPKYLYSRM